MFHFWIDLVFVSHSLTLFTSSRYIGKMYVNGIHLIYVFANAEKLRIVKIPIFTLVFHSIHNRTCMHTGHTHTVTSQQENGRKTKLSNM